MVTSLLFILHHFCYKSIGLATELTSSQGNVLRRGGYAQFVMKGSALAVVAPGLLLQLPATNGHVTGRHCEVQLKGACSQGDIHTGEPGPCAA